MRIVLLIFTYIFCSGFTLLSGPRKAILLSSENDPVVEFYWNGDVPPLDEKEKLFGGIYANMSDQEVMANLLQRAFDVWNSVEGSYLQMRVILSPTTTVNSIDGVNAVVVKSFDNAAAAAFAVPMVSGDGNWIEDCDITVSNKKVSAPDLYITLIHEIGHCIGLGHNHTNYNSIMGYSRMRRDGGLGLDDKAGIIYLYTTEAFKDEEKEFLGCAVVGAKSRPWASLLILLPLVAIVPWRRLSKKSTL
jgi:hypothetical protein